MFSTADSKPNNDILIPLENLRKLRFTGLSEIIILSKIFFQFCSKPSSASGATKRRKKEKRRN